MRRDGRLGFVSLVLSGVAVACGARSELVGPDETEPPDDAAVLDASHEPDVVVDSPGDAPGDALVDAPGDAIEDAPEDALEDAPEDVIVDAPEDVIVDAPEDHPPDACVDPPVCDPADPSHIFQCGGAIQQCSVLEQCQDQGAGAHCTNPCTDTLGQDTSNGCEFYAAQMDAVPEGAGACFAVFVVNQWKTGAPAKLEVSRGGVVLPVDPFARLPSGKGAAITYAPYDSAAGLAKDQVAILFLSRDPAAQSDPDPTAPRRLADCPAGVTPAVVGDAAQHGTGVGDAFRIKSNVPIVAYQILPYGAGRARITGATLLFPTNVWDTNYLAVNAYTAPTSFTELRAGPTMVILGQQDGTHVTIKPVVDIAAGGGLAGTPANVPVTYTVNRGQYLQFTQPAELTGSAIEADHAVAVIGGSTIMDVPVSTTRADGAEQMLPPVSALASEYVAVRYRSRDKLAEEVVPWRLVGAVDGTQLTYEPAPPAGAPTTINARQLVEFSDPGPFVVKSQDAAHPFYVAGYMTGGAPFDGEGDPEFVNVISPRQYLSRYTFFTDPTYPETNLVVVRVLDAQTGVFPEVTLDCAGTLGGWSPVGSSGVYQFTRIDLSSGDFVGQNGCDNGVHTMTATLPDGGDAGPAPTPLFGVTIWGWGNPITWPPDNMGSDEANPKFTRWVSYAYPAGVNLAKLNNVIVPAH
jgi:hypothetical protein